MLKLIFNFACGIADQEKIKNKGPWEVLGERKDLYLLSSSPFTGQFGDDSYRFLILWNRSRNLGSTIF
jgi:hypothetical protein